MNSSRWLRSNQCGKTAFCFRPSGFTLIELLVVIAIVSILAAILLPVFAQAKMAAKKSAHVSNFRQMALANMLYVADNGAYPPMSSPVTQRPRVRWPDRLYPYIKSEDIFGGTLTPRWMQRKRFAHNSRRRFGGIGYNYQYLGNSRTVLGSDQLPFGANDTWIQQPSDTVLLADTRGVRNDLGQLTGGEYVVDPPLRSLRGSGVPSGFYGDGVACGSGTPRTPGAWGCRSIPIARMTGRVAVVFCDTHIRPLRLRQLYDSNGNGRWDNGYWNGMGDPSRR
ncbi:type II secretion system protein [Kamptonema cortianum]|nr:type II secretion system protein [Geitlerinema splendidum]MDK3157048.1 type II secretion system protein [Kamptonema cortianum]